MKIKFIMITLALFASVSGYTEESRQRFLDLPEEPSLAIDYTASSEDYVDDEFELKLKKEEVLLNLYSQSIRGKMPLNKFYQILIQWGAPKDFIKNLDEIYNKLESDEITVEEAEVALKEAIATLNKARKRGQKYSGYLDRTTFFIAVLPVFFLIAD